MKLSKKLAHHIAMRINGLLVWDRMIHEDLAKIDKGEYDHEKFMRLKSWYNEEVDALRELGIDPVHKFGEGYREVA